ncbi:MAG: ABC transporter ATP-binding protein [Anaerolineae bacterium]|nr:ABC transporter ATP-binding protein [Anaerolineae bacterium]
MSTLLEVRDLHVEVAGEEILHGVDLTIPEGEVHALFGPNGSGKTSLMMTIMGFSGYEITQGAVLFDGKDITDLDVTERARLGIGVAQQRPPTITGVQLHQVLDYAVDNGLCPREHLQELLAQARLDDFLTRDINGGLSGGEIRRSEILQLMVTQPRFAMMDEPDSGVDVEAMKLVGQMLNELFSLETSHPAKRRTGLIITHTGQILNYIQADKGHVMMRGELACSGNPRLIFDTACTSGYEICVQCINGVEV